MRYHKDVYMPKKVKDKLEAHTKALNALKWQYTSHSIDNLKARCYDIPSLLLFIKGLQLDYSQVFEVYTNNSGSIEKACYRIDYSLFDIILVVTPDKKIITIYINDKQDKHATLDKSIYTCT